jgi:CheY-like chemotaxis protein
MDISMPLMSGVEATQVIRRTPAVRLIPIIALTAHAMEGDAEKCLAVGCDAFATKPVRFGELLELIKKIAAGADLGETREARG